MDPARPSQGDSAQSPITVVDLIRHGSPVGGRKYRGQIDDPLSEPGWAQMRAAVEPYFVHGAPWTRVVSSTLSRCQAFAEELAARLGVGAELDDRLREVRFGAWEGRRGAEIDAEAPGTLQAFYADPINARPADAEPLMDFYDRAGSAFDDIVDRLAGEHVMVVTHAGVIRAISARVLGVPLSHMYRLQVANASITRIRIDGVRPPTLMFHGRDVAPNPATEPVGEQSPG
ncbi:MAG: alpha-ribazole phosphatase family protein [Gammaproteobacteria bacterium]